MSRASLVCVVAVASFIAPALVAQRGNSSGQIGQDAPPKATALILGRVVDGASGQPIAEAIVTLTRAGRGRGLPPGAATSRGGAAPPPQTPATMAAGATPPGPQRVMTGADGRFVFHGLLPGQFQLAASLTGYTPSLSVNLGAGPAATIAALAGRGSPAAPVPLALSEGELATGVTLRLWKHAVVSGTVLDDAGEPAIGVMVQVARRMMAAGRVRYVPGASALTDDRGSYRISSLVPGDYLVVVPQTPVSIPTAVMTGVIDSMSGGNPGGGLALMDLMTSGINPGEAMSGGVRVGDVMVASRGSVPLTGPDGRLQAYQTVFYPGGSSAVQASVVSLTSGEERTDVHLQLRLIPTSRVSGRAMGPSGPVANLGIHLVVPADGLVSESEFDVATAMTKADGTFAFHGVPPGQFLLRAQRQPRPELPAEAMSSSAAQLLFGVAAAPTEFLFGVAPVTVSGGDVDGVALSLTTGFSVSGRLEFDSQSGRQAGAPAPLQGVLVMLTPSDGRTPSASGFGSPLSTPDRANAPGEFRTKGYPPGRYFLTITGPPVKSATAAGRDVLDAALEIRNSDVTDVVVVLADRLAQLSGTVRAAAGADVSETSILLFPANYRAWVESDMNPRRARTTRASRTGAYSLMNLPAGEYFVAAIDRASEGDLQDPAFVEALARVATRVTVGADMQTLNLNTVRVTR